MLAFTTDGYNIVYISEGNAQIGGKKKLSCTVFVVIPAYEECV